MLKRVDERDASPKQTSELKKGGGKHLKRRSQVNSRSRTLFGRPFRQLSDIDCLPRRRRGRRL